MKKLFLILACLTLGLGYAQADLTVKSEKLDVTQLPQLDLNFTTSGYIYFSCPQMGNYGLVEIELDIENVLVNGSLGRCSLIDNENAPIEATASSYVVLSSIKVYSSSGYTASDFSFNINGIAAY